MSKNNKSIKFYVISFFLGCGAYYVFLCFTGVVLAFLADIGFDSFVIPNLLNRLSDASIRHVVLSIYIEVIPIVVCFVVLFLATYFLSKPLSQKLIINSLILTFGAFCTDFYYFQKSPFDLSYFFGSRYTVNYFNIIIWLLCTIAGIYLGRILKMKSVQPPAKPDAGHNATF